jgi:hypothetical protein
LRSKADGRAGEDEAGTPEGQKGLGREIGVLEGLSLSRSTFQQRNHDRIEDHSLRIRELIKSVENDLLSDPKSDGPPDENTLVHEVFDRLVQLRIRDAHSGPPQAGE